MSWDDVTEEHAGGEDTGAEHSGGEHSGGERTGGEHPMRANLIGLGLIGGSIALGLSNAGWSVWGEDDDPEVCAKALAAGAITAIGRQRDVDVTFVAVPVSRIAAVVADALGTTSGAVTDVGSTKGTVVAAVDDPRFVGDHPMAGSELDGFEAADPALFSGAVWVLTPTEHTDDRALSTVAGAARALGAEVIALGAEQHDRVVATISHVPHLTAATLMGVASQRSVEHQALLRLAAGGFRDMTRIASGAPGIWLDICDENRTAIVGALDELIDGLDGVRTIVADGDRAGLEKVLRSAREARANLPSRALHPENLAEVRIPILDRSGAAAEIFTLAADLAVNVANFEVVHSAEGDRGIAIVTVDAESVERFRGGLMARGFRPAITSLE